MPCCHSNIPWLRNSPELFPGCLSNFLWLRNSPELFPGCLSNIPWLRNSPDLLPGCLSNILWLRNSPELFPGSEIPLNYCLAVLAIFSGSEIPLKYSLAQKFPELFPCCHTNVPWLRNSPELLPGCLSNFSWLENSHELFPGHPEISLNYSLAQKFPSIIPWLSLYQSSWVRSPITSIKKLCMLVILAVGRIPLAPRFASIIDLIHLYVWERTWAVSRKSKIAISLHQIYFYVEEIAGL